MKIIRRKRVTIKAQITPEGVTLDDGTVRTGNSSIYQIARHLISVGHSPQDKLEVYRGDMLCLSGSLTAFGRLTWGGSDKDPRPAPWRPMADTPISSRLQSWYEGLK